MTLASSSPALVALEHDFQRHRLDLVGLSGRAERLVAGLADRGHALGRLGQVLARVEVGLVVVEVLADRAGRGHAQVGVDIDLAHAVLDAFDDLFHRHAVGLAHVAAVAVDDLQPVLRHRGGAVHHQMDGRDALVDFLHPVDTQDLAGRLLGELVGAVAGADGDRQGVEVGLS